MTAYSEDALSLEAEDGFPLAATALVPEHPKASLLLSSGTGFPKEFYLRLARLGAERGYAVLIYDYRGIAGSMPKGGLKGFRADMMDWGRLDMTAAGQAAMELAPGKPFTMMGHSVGGHLVGFSPIGPKAAAHAFLNVGSGYWGKSAWHYRPMALFFWLAYGPACLALKGYIPEGGLWGGTALPRDVYTLWRNWCFKPGYYGDVLDELTPHWFADVTAPIRAWGAADDPIANPATTADILMLYTAAGKENIWLEPSDYGLKQIGHQGLMSRRSAVIWPEIYDWLDGVIGVTSETAP